MKIGIQTAGIPYDFGRREGYQMIRDAGFETIDWNIDMQLTNADILSHKHAGNVFEKSLDEILAFYADDLDGIRAAGLTITQAHAPFNFYNNDPEGPSLEYMSKIYQNVILLCDAVGCKNVVIHGASRGRNDQHTNEEMEEINRTLYTSLIPTLQKTNVTVCLENLFVSKGGLTAGHCANPYEAAKLIDELNAAAGKECFGFCVDTGHLNLLAIDFRSYMPILGKRIKALHIHDNDGATDLHKAPYTGTIDWKQFYEQLAKIGYEGDLAFETFRQTEVNVLGDREMVMPWMKLIATIGEFFRSKIAELKA